jgi:hypothetical protein
VMIRRLPFYRGDTIAASCFITNVVRLTLSVQRFAFA